MRYVSSDPQTYRHRVHPNPCSGALRKDRGGPPRAGGRASSGATISRESRVALALSKIVVSRLLMGSAHVLPYLCKAIQRPYCLPSTINQVDKICNDSFTLCHFPSPRLLKNLPLITCCTRIHIISLILALPSLSIGNCPRTFGYL